MKKLILFAIVLCFTIAGTTTAFAGSKIKMIRIGTEGAYPPYNYVDKNGKVQGFDIDIAKALCKSAGVKYKFVVQDWDGLIPGLVAKKFDCIIASMSITDERKKKVSFTHKYYSTPAKFVAKKGSHFKITKAGLKGKIIGVQRGTVAANFANDEFGKVATVKSYTTQDEANLDLVSGRVDLVVADSVVLNGGFLSKPMGKDFEFVGPGFNDPKWFGEGIGIAVRKGDTALVNLFNTAIDKIRADGTYRKINAKYFDFDVYGD
jgi:lysine-arginine-ornithine-binding protein